LNGDLRAIFNPHMIRPEPTVRGWIGLFGKKADGDANGDTAGQRNIREQHRKRVGVHVAIFSGRGYANN